MTLRQRFKSSIRRGTGEAILILKEHEQADFSKEIIYTATHDLAYNSQSEGTRAAFLYDIIILAQQKKTILDAILSCLLRQKDDHNALHQMCEIARLAAQDGYTKARTTLYKRFYKNLKKGYTRCGEESILALDGKNGLLRVADVIGQKLKANPEAWQDNFMQNQFQEDNPDIDVQAFLNAAAVTNDNIKAYIRGVEENNELNSNDESREPVAFAYASVKSRIETGTWKYIPSAIIKELSANDVQLLADDLLKEKNPKKLKIYLRIFGRVQFPYSYTSILAIAENNRFAKAGLIPFALRALTYFNAPEIRKFAMGKIAASKFSENFLPPLVMNYKKGDGKLLSATIAKLKQQDRLHYIALYLSDIYDANPTAECKEPIELIYEKLDCSICRRNLVKILITNNVLSQKIRDELRYDCNYEIRKLVSQ